MLEQTCSVWHNSLTIDLETDLKRVKKCELQIILGRHYKSYKEACNRVGIEDLVSRRTRLCLNLAKKCLSNPKIKHFFPQNKKRNIMITRNHDKFVADKAHTERLKKPAIPYMQKLLNSENKLKENR